MGIARWIKHSLPCWYDIRGLLILKLAYRISLSELINWFAVNISENHLEVAVGSGAVLQRCLKVYGDRHKGIIDAIDIDPGMVARSEAVLCRHLSDCSVMNAEDLAHSERKYRSINLANCVHCFGNPDAVIMGAAHCLSHGGTMAANVLLHPDTGTLSGFLADIVNRYGRWKGIFIQPYSSAEVTQMFSRHGMEVMDSVVSGNCMFIRSQKKWTTVK